LLLSHVHGGGMTPKAVLWVLLLPAVSSSLLLLLLRTPGAVLLRLLQLEARWQPPWQGGQT
jgi:hypothetical protein